MTGSRRREPAPETVAKDNRLTRDEARAIATRVDERQELIDAAAKEHAYQARVAAHFRHLGASDSQVCAQSAGLSVLAAHGLRGELVLPVPLLLESNPRLLAYYRPLFGYSQKLFYTAATGMGRFRAMEERGVITPKNVPDLRPMCTHLGSIGAMLLAGVGTACISDEFRDDLTLLTIGPQWRRSQY